MKTSFNKSSRLVAAVISLVFLFGEAFSQMDSLYPQTNYDIHTMITGGGITDLNGIGGIANLTFMYNRHVFGFSYAIEGIGIGKVVTDITYGALGGSSETSFTAEIKKIYAIEYGRRLSKIISVTGGIAWVTDNSRAAINGHQDPGHEEGGFLFKWFVQGSYHADLVERKREYLAVPITIKAYFKTSLAAGIELHLQLLPNLQEPMGNIGILFGFGNFPGNE